ncbi:MAG: ABC transporter ATP-binding protein, partial [Eubacteriales bacterium]|nr:ABC transporter ATP-binding protein [Eubacteriales bacterium]
MEKTGKSEHRNKEQGKRAETRFFGIPLIMPFLRPYVPTVLLMIFLGILSSVADSIYPLFNSWALDHFVAERSLEGLPVFLFLYILLMILQELDNYYCLYECGHVEVAIDRDLRNAAFSHLQTLSFSYFNQNSVGYIHARTMSDTERIGELMAWRMMDVVWNVSYIVCVAGVMLAVNARLALYVLVMVPAAAAIILYFQKKIVEGSRQVREINAQITGSFNEGISGIRSIKTLRIEDVMKRGFEAETGDMRRTAVRTARHSALLTSAITFLSSMALALVLWRGGRLTMEGLLRIGTLSVFMSYAVGMLEPIRQIITSLSALISIQVNIERFTALLEETSNVVDTPEVIEKYGDQFHAKKENWEPLYGDVEFKDVSFMYPDGNEMVLEHFNLKVPRGTNLAIVGETGAGKSTLVNLACRFYEPTKGQVLIDGRDARERSQLWLHSKIGYVLQTPYLFSGTVRDNLRYGKPDATEEEIREALRLASADFVVDRMEKGLDSDVGEGGSLLSTGEKQLLSIARAILADPRILVLDEATSSVDTVTERAIQEAVSALIRGRTSFVIAHRLSTVTGADVILAVRDGKILEKGTHSELMRKKGYYYQLYTRQYEESVWA